MFFYKLFLLLCFIGCLKFTLAYNVPDDLEAISTLSHTSFRLYENPFFIYVDFQSLEKCTKESEGICICYWGFNAPPAIKLKNQLSPNEKKVYKNHGNGDREIKKASSLNGVHCGRLDSMKTSKKYRFNEETGEKWKKVHQGHLGSKFGLQKICISAVEKTMNFTDGGSLSHYEITVKTTGNNGVANDAHVAKVKRMASEGFLQLQFNTKMGVLQTLGEISNENAEFFVIPQIAQIQAFEPHDQKDVEIEDTFIQMDYNACLNDYGKYINDILYFSKSDLKNTAYTDTPNKIDTYHGSLLMPNPSDPRAPYSMIPVDQTEAEDILFDEILYFEYKPIKK